LTTSAPGLRFAPSGLRGYEDLRRLPDRVVDQRLAERPDRAGDLVAGGDDVVERFFDPAAVFFRDHERRQQLDGVAAVAGDLREDLVILEQRHGDELAEQAFVRGLQEIPGSLQLQRFRRTELDEAEGDRKSTRLNSSHVEISYAVFCLKKKKTQYSQQQRKYDMLYP